MNIQCNFKKQCTYIFFGLFFLFFSSVHGYSAVDESIHSAWGELLKKHVSDGAVNYSAFKMDEGKLDEYLNVLNQTNPEELSEKDQLALYMNAYNAYTVKLILKNFSDGKPVSSIKRLGGFFSGPWKIKFVDIGGKTYTLDNVEHDIIRPRFKEPRIHFAINCAAKSCPPLIPEAYEGKILDKQLDENTIAFINDPQSNYLKGSTLYVSKIFSWFSEDFTDGTAAFVKKYAQGELKAKLDQLGNSVSVEYLDYDWSLNGQ